MRSDITPCARQRSFLDLLTVAESNPTMSALRRSNCPHMPTTLWSPR
jgi:hypothetical protein